MTFKRPVLLFSTPRSGSSAVYQILANSLQKLGGWQPLGEFFETKYHRFVNTGTGIAVEFAPSGEPLPVIGEVRTSSIRQRQVERAALLRQYPNAYTLKVFPEHLCYEAFVWLLRHYDWIFLERRDVLAQVLSFLTADLTDFAKAPDPTRMTANRVAFTKIESYLLFYRNLKALVAPTHVLEYETFCNQGYEQFLRSLDLPVASTHGFVRPLDAAATESRLSRFTNADEILSWYHGSPISDPEKAPEIEFRSGLMRLFDFDSQSKLKQQYAHMIRRFRIMRSDRRILRGKLSIVESLLVEARLAGVKDLNKL